MNHNTSETPSPSGDGFISELPSIGIGLPYFPEFSAIAGSFKAALALSFFSALAEECDDICVTHQDIQDGTGLSSAETKSVLSSLREQGLLTVTRKGMPAKDYYELDWQEICSRVESRKGTSVASISISLVEVKLTGDVDADGGIDPFIRLSEGGDDLWVLPFRAMDENLLWRAIQDPELSCAAKGVAAIMLTLEKDLYYSTAEQVRYEIGKRAKQGKTAISNYYGELKNKKYIPRRPSNCNYGKPGFVYFAASPRTGLVKIGSSQDPISRSKQLGGQVQDPDVALVHVINCPGDMGTVESALHRHYAPWKVFGEWFKLSNAQLAYIRCWCNGYVSNPLEVA